MSFKKKLMALGIALAFSVAAAVPALAYAYDPFWASYPNLTPYNSSYNYVIDQSSGGSQQISVQGLDANWTNTSLFTATALADDINWSITPTVSNVTVTDNGHALVSPGKYRAPATVSVGSNAPYGPYYVEASNPVGGTLGFSFAVNPSTPQSSVNANVRIYNGGLGSSYLALSQTNVGVACNNVTTSAGINYPSAMDALAAVATVSHYTYGGSEYVSGVTFTPTGSSTTITLPDPDNPISGYYWTYCVYDSNGNKVDLSYNIGSEVYAIDSGCTVVWVYGGWVTFPSTLSAI